MGDLIFSAKYVPADIKEFASTRETSDEIAMAIFELAAEGDEARLWADPIDAEMADVAKRAWELADPTVTELHWGVTTLQRPRSKGTMTIYEALKQKLGREPKYTELQAEVKRIRTKNQAMTKEHIATLGKLRHQKQKRNV